ncbi:MAG: TIM barrel protein [Vicinamibacterales bacterium]
MLTRRDFLLTTAAVAGVTALPRAAARITIGYAAITWGGNDVKAIEDVGALGFKGIQLRSSAVDRFADKPAELKALLQQHRLTMAVLSSGNLRLDPAFEADDLAKHTKNAQFVKTVGGLHLQVIDEPPKGKALTPDDYTRMGRLLTELGKRTADAGVPLVYHHHMNSMSQPPEGPAAIMDASDPKYVRLLLDVAHFQQGGGDPVKAVTQFRDRIGVVHLKDVVSPAPSVGGAPPRPYQFVELGRGTVNLQAVTAALNQINYNGWAMVELDAVPDPSRSPKDCAVISRDYLQRELHLDL